MTFSQSRLQNSQGTLISQWMINDNLIRLFHLPQVGLLSFADGRTGKVTKFRSTLYNVDYAISLVTLFHNTIRENLKNDIPNSSCFLPKLCMKAQGDAKIQIALFGRIDVQSDARGILKGVRWGVFDTSKNEEQTFEIDDQNHTIRNFLWEAPSSNHPHFVETGRDRENKPIMKLAEDSYAMAAYAKYFSVNLIRDPKNRVQQIQGVALNRVSLLDRDVIVNEEKWAITLVSALYSTRGLYSSSSIPNVGHAMLACEGVIAGKQFLRYIHFTQNPRDNHPNRQDNEGQIESFERKTPLITINGPTLTRSKNAIENMFEFVELINGNPYRFSLSFGSIYDFRPDIKWNTHLLKFLRKIEIYVQPNIQSNEHWSQDSVNFEMQKIQQQFRRKHSFSFPKTCLDCVYTIATFAGVIFRGNRPFTTPLNKAALLHNAPIFQIPSGFNPQLLGNSFPETHSAINRGIVSAGIVLTPDDCPPNKFLDWDWQIAIEEIATIKRTFSKILNSHTLNEVNRNHILPKNW